MTSGDGRHDGRSERRTRRRGEHVLYAVEDDDDCEEGSDSPHRPRLFIDQKQVFSALHLNLNLDLDLDPCLASPRITKITKGPSHRVPKFPY